MRRDVPAARHAGRRGDARARRQRRRRRARHRDHPHRRRAVQQRHRLRPVRHPVGRPRARGPQRVRPRAGSVVATALRRPSGDAPARLGHGLDSRRGVGLGGAVPPLRQAAVRRPLRAGDPLRARRLRGVADHLGEVACGRAADAAGPRLAGALPAARTRAAARRAFRVAGDGVDTRQDRALERRRVLPRRARGRDGRALAPAWRRARRGRFRRARRRLGHAARPRLPWHHRQRDPPQRPGHRGADRARRPRALRPRVAAAGFGGEPAPADRGDEAGVRGRASLCRRRSPHGGDTGGHARSRLSRGTRQADRSRARRISAPARRRAAAPSISAPPTPAA